MSREEKFLQAYQEQVADLAKQYQSVELPELTEELFALFEQNGNRLQYEAVYFERRKQLALYGMAVIFFQREGDLQKLITILNAICEETCWALPAHVNRNQAGWEHTVDLFASETAQALAEITTVLGKSLPASLKQKVKEEIEARVFQPFFDSKPHSLSWEGCTHNWNAVCAGAIGSACIYLMKEEPERQEGCLQRICASLEQYLNGFMEDGTCMEGIGYFTYGMSYYTGFAKQLYDYTKGQKNLFAHPKLEKIAQFQQKMYFEANGTDNSLTVSFSDGEVHAKFRMGLTLFLAGLYDGVKIPPMSCACDFSSDSCYRWLELYRDYVWTKEKIGILKQKEKTSNQCQRRQDILPDAQWSICESENGVGMAIKGGDNGEPHNHNDVASFLYQIQGEPMLADLGAGEYTKEYFGAGRYDILCNSSLGHNVPLINGKQQKAGKEYRASTFEADGKGTVKLRFQTAYEEGMLDLAERTAHFSLQNGSLLLQDSFVAREQTTVITENFVTQCRVVMKEDGVWLYGTKAVCVIRPKTRKNCSAKAVCQKVLHKNHEGNSEEVVLIQWEYTLQNNLMAEEGRILCEFLIEPVF